LAQVANAIFGFVFWIIAARLYTAEVVGLTSAILSVAGLLVTISSVGLGYGLIRFLNSNKNPVKLINSSFTVTGLLSLAATGIFIIGLGIWSPGLDILRNDPHYLVVFLFFVPVSVFASLIDQTLMAKRQAKFIFIRSLIFNILRLALLVLLAVFFQSLGILGSWSTAVFIALLVGVFILLPRAQPGYKLSFTVDRKMVSEIQHYSFLNYLGDLFWNLPGLVLPIIIVNLLGADSNAYFYMAWAMAGTLTMIPTSIATSLLAEGSHDEALLKYHIRRSLRILVLLLIPAAIIVWFLADKFLLLYGGLYAKNATTLLRWLAIASLPIAINTIYFSIKRIQKQVTPVIILAVIMALITVLVSYLLLPRFGINGVGIAWLGAQSISAVIAIVWYIRSGAGS